MFAMIRKELRVLLRDKAALVTLFLSPVLFITVMSLALGGSFSELGSDAPKLRIAVVDQDGSVPARAVTRALGGSDDLRVVTDDASGGALTQAQASAQVRKGDQSLAVVIPAGFGDDVGDGGTPKVSLIVDPSAARQAVDPLKSAVDGAVRGVAVHTRAASALSREIRTSTDPARRAELRSQLSRLTVPEVQAKVSYPEGMTPPRYPTVYQQNVPAYTVMYVFFIVTVMAGSLMTERREGTFRRLLSSPVPRWRLLLGKITPYFLVALVQVATLTAFGHWVFGMDLGEHPVALLPIAAATACCAVAMGLLLASFARTETQVNSIGTIAVLVLAALGGCMVPSVFMPSFMQDITIWTPQGRALQAFQDVLVRGADLPAVLLTSGLLVGLAAVLFAVALPRFRFLR
ncbi:ABC transporter permease [Streptomyces sp. NPDC048248]|uniref:ABC transporter permease n=1 Tax=Streptomyces sp. NPDC048248 TaxID=3365523 RepID=UPI00371B45ED